MSTMLRKIMGDSDNGNVHTTTNNTNKPPSKIATLLESWKKLDDNLSSFERLASMRRMVVEGELGAESYDMLHGLAVERATGKERRPSVLGTLQGVEQPIMAGYLYHRTQKTWKKRYVLLFTARLEYHNSKAISEQKLGQGTILTLNEKHFVGDSATRHLKNDKEFSFMVSDFTTTHYFAAESQELRKFWMHTIARTIKKLQAAKEAFDQQQQSIVGRVERSPSAVDRDYQERLNAYAASIGSTPPRTSPPAKQVASPAATPTPSSSSNARLQSVRLLEEAANMETKRIEHVALQKLYEEQAAELAAEAEMVQDKSTPEAFEKIEKQRIALEERAGLEASVAAEFQDLVQARESESAEVLARADIEKEINRRSVTRPKSMKPSATQMAAILQAAQQTAPPAPTPQFGEVDIAPTVNEVVATEEDDVEEAEFKTQAVEAAARRVDEERDQRFKEAKQAMKEADEMLKAAAEARAKAEAHAKSAQLVAAPVIPAVDISPDAALLKVQAERAAALQKATAMQKYLLQSKEALEKSKQKAQAKMGQQSQKPSGGLTKQPSTELPMSKVATTTTTTTAVPPPVQRTVSPMPVQVNQQITLLLNLISKTGTKAQNGGISITFANLYKAYDKATEGITVDDDDDSIYDVAGLLLQCKRSGNVKYDGFQLFRGKDDHIVIFLA